jgi:DNA-binding MarR family transcriptional regulator
VTASGFARWTESELVPDEGIAEVRAHPRFAEAMRLSVQNALTLYETNPIVRATTNDTGRALAAVIALYLHATGGLTAGRLQTLCEEAGIASPGRVTAILWRLRLLGYIAASPVQADRRVRLYEPTPLMHDAFRTRLQGELAALALLEAMAADALARFGDPAFFNAFIAKMGEGLLAAGKRHQPEKSKLDLFSERTAGLPILYTLLLGGAAADTFPPHGPIPIVIAELSRHFSVSRTHVLRLLRAAEEVGLIRRYASETTVFLEESLRLEVERFYAVTYIGFSLFAISALRCCPLEISVL